jgi:hypothetical protein
MYSGPVTLPHWILSSSLALICTVIASSATKAGRMIDSLDPAPLSIVDACQMATQIAGEEDSVVRDGFRQMFGINCSSGANVETTSTDHADLSAARKSTTCLTQWLGGHFRLVIPNPVPTSLLKIPIASRHAFPT